MTTQNPNTVFTYDEKLALAAEEHIFEEDKEVILAYNRGRALDFEKCSEQERAEYEKQFQEELNNASN